MVEVTVVYLGINWVIWQRQSDNTVITILTITTTIIVVIITTIIIIVAVVITTIIILTSSECLPLKWYIWVRGGIIMLPPSVYYYMTKQLSCPIKKPRRKHYIIIRQYSFLADHHISTFCSNHQIFIHLKMRKRECEAGCPFQGIHFAIQTNTFCNPDKYILQSRQIHFAI